MAERQTVALDVVGSTPTTHPNLFLITFRRTSLNGVRFALSQPQLVVSEPNRLPWADLRFSCNVFPVSITIQ